MAMFLEPECLPASMPFEAGRSSLQERNPYLSEKIERSMEQLDSGHGTSHDLIEVDNE